MPITLQVGSIPTLSKISYSPIFYQKYQTYKVKKIPISIHWTHSIAASRSWLSHVPMNIGQVNKQGGLESYWVHPKIKRELNGFIVICLSHRKNDDELSLFTYLIFLEKQ